MSNSCEMQQQSLLFERIIFILTDDVYYDLFFYADDTCLVYQHKDFNKINQNLNKFFPTISDWFVDKKLSIHFGDDKTKSILLAQTIESAVLKLDMVQYTLSNITQ